MGVFGFIENFFFISLGIVFGLVLLLVYHFKNRMLVAEKKSESMYGLLSTVVKEIKNIRNTFGYASKPAQEPSLPQEVRLKSEPEISVSVKPVSSPEVITLELTASEIPTLPRAGSKIVVSDDEDNSDSESSDGIDSGESEESDADSADYDSESDEEVDNIVLEPIIQADLKHDMELEDKNILEELRLDETIIHLSTDEVASQKNGDVQIELTHLVLSPDELPITDATVSEFEEFSPAEPKYETEPEKVVNEESNNATKGLVEEFFVGEPVSKPEKQSVEHLRKMNINQLRTIAIQLGITADTSKMKKNELISLIHPK